MIIPVILFLSDVVRMTCFQAFTAGIERDGKACEKYKFARCVKKTCKEVKDFANNDWFYVRCSVFVEFVVVVIAVSFFL